MQKRNEEKPNVAVIGGGAAGLTAAIHAARAGAAVTIFERNDRVGKKILVTGNGRCNLTNQDLDTRHYHGNPGFAMKTIGRFGADKTGEFFSGLGIRFQSAENGKVFPRSQQAGSVLDALRFEAELLGIEVFTGIMISSVKKEGGTFILNTRAGKSFRFPKVVLACGGKADPDLGSDGSGYDLAKGLGHEITEVFPALSQLRLGGGLYRQMERMKWEGEIRAVDGDGAFASSRGDMIFTSYGISGTAVLSVSRSVMERISGNRTVYLEADLLPDWKMDETLKELAKRRDDQPERKLEEFFLGLLNKRIGQTLLKSVGLELTRMSGSLSENETGNIAHAIHAWRFEVTGHNGWQNAQTTAGGVRTDEVDPETMESKKSGGLFFAGEILDVDGDSGGYNLQWAWSSGAVAGISAAGGKP